MMLGNKTLVCKLFRRDSQSCKVGVQVLAAMLSVSAYSAELNSDI